MPANKYTGAQAKTICARVSEGEPLQVICRDLKIKWRTVYDWLKAHEDFARDYATAREIGYDAIAEEALRIADTPVNGEERTVGPDGATITVTTREMLGHRRLQVWTRLQLLAKWNPKKYGQNVNLRGDGSAPVHLVLEGSDRDG